MRRKGSWLALAILICAPGALWADEWTAMQDVFDQGAREAQRWQWGWAAGYGVASAYYAVESDQADDRDDRYDARVSMVKSLLGLADVLVFPQPHRRAQRDFNAAREQGDIETARAQMAALAEREQERRSLRARTGPFLVNLAGGLLIALEDDRPGDGALNFATGMLVSEIRIRTQSTVASDYRSGPAFTLRAGGGTLPVEYDWVLTPQMAAVQFRF